MNSNETLPEQTLERTLKAAASFLKRHKNDTEIDRTFGYFTTHPFAPLNKKRLRMMLQQVQAQSAELGRPLRILDLACGAGLITCAMAGLGHRALGLDLSKDEILLARLFAQEEKLDGSFIQMDLLNTPDWEKTVEEVLGGKPDVVVLAYALHHLPQVDSFTERLSRWLPSGARLLINEENPRSPLFRLKHVVRGWIQKDTESEWHRSYDGWKDMVEARGFKASEPLGADMMPGLASTAPLRCWSLVFSAQRQ